MASEIWMFVVGDSASPYLGRHPQIVTISSHFKLISADKRGIDERVNWFFLIWIRRHKYYFCHNRESTMLDIQSLILNTYSHPRLKRRTKSSDNCNACTDIRCCWLVAARSRLGRGKNSASRVSCFFLYVRDIYPSKLQNTGPRCNIESRRSRGPNIAPRIGVLERNNAW